MIEQYHDVLADGASRWDIELPGSPHGGGAVRDARVRAQRLPLGTGAFSAVAEPRACAGAPIEVAIDSDRAFTLEVRRDDGASSLHDIQPGHTALVVP